jgi:tetratricopeptide (TPR) repeat protein
LTTAKSLLGVVNFLCDEGKLDEAVELCQRAVEINLGTAFVHNNVAWVLATQRDVELRDSTRAVQLARKAVELEPANGAHWNTLGVAHYRTGELNAAIEALEKSDDVLQGQLFSFNGFFLAMAHWQLGRQDDARKWYAKSVEWMDDNMTDNEELARFRAEAEETLNVTVGGETHAKPPPPPLPHPTDN